MTKQTFNNGTKGGSKDFFEAIAGPILYDEQSPYRLMTHKLNDIDTDYFEGATPLGKTVDKDIEIDIKRRILNDFVTYGNKLLAEKSEDIQHVIINNVQELIDHYDDKDKALCDLNKSFDYLNTFVRKQLCFVPIPMYDNSELRELYVAAKRVTLLEKVTGGNNKDVIKYYHALIEHTVWACRMLLRRRAGQFLMQMVDVLSHKFSLDSPWTTTYNETRQKDYSDKLPESLLPLAELMAENVHKVWMQTRIEQGWTYGPERDDAEKTHPCLVPYNQLPEEEKVYDRNTSIETLRFIISHGFRIEKEDYDDQTEIHSAKPSN